jgi:hypothetical protein
MYNNNPTFSRVEIENNKDVIDDVFHSVYITNINGGYNGNMGKNN